MSEYRKLRIIIVSGLSGAGKTVALRALEDSGFFCIDNLPATLIEPFLSTIDMTAIKNIGIGVDIREKSFLKDAYKILAALQESHTVEILFFEADKDVMIRRFKETRRPHPMMTIKKGISLEEAVEEEKRQLAVLRESADRVVDTSAFTPHQLRYMVISTYGQSEMAQKLDIALISFGYKYGIPQNADLLFDVRFLPNPYFIPSLKPFNGLNKEVNDYVMSNVDTSELIERLENLFDFLIPRYIDEGRAYLSIGIGCTGGMHRSPVIVEELTKYFKKRHGIEVSIIHRDMG
jgi:RNase adapter protein RapZ